MRISTLSVNDYVNLIGHYNRIQEGPTIDPRLLDRFKDQPERLEQIKAQAMSGKTRHQKSLNVVFKKPLEEFEYLPFGYVYSLYRKYSDHGVLPFEGPLANQPAQIMEVFNTLDGIESEYQEKARREAEAKAKRNSKR